MASNIHFLNQGVADAFLHKRKLRAWLERLIHAHGQHVDELNFVLMDDATLLSYNQRYLDHDTLTDVITFDHGSPTGAIVADVLISWERVRENARERSVSSQEELHRVMAHGVLHLLGFNDKTEGPRSKMRAAEGQALNDYLLNYST